jgi:hypothetical protein
MKKSFAVVFFCFLVGGFLHAEVLLDQTFDDMSGKVAAKGSLKRASYIIVEPGQGAIGTDPAAHFLDDSTDEAGIFEYNLEKAGAFFISFDLLNNLPAAEAGHRLIFGMGPWVDGKGTALSSGAKRAFSVEFEQVASKGLNIRLGKDSAQKGEYDATAVQQVKIWVNDNDTAEVSYIRPDTKAATKLDPDSVVVWINDQLVGKEEANGIAMKTANSMLSVGDKVLARIGFVSKSTETTDFWIDNLHVEGISP